jgi:hypothetical protein
MESRAQVIQVLVVRPTQEAKDNEGEHMTRKVWYTTDDYGTLWRFVETASGVRFWWDAIHETVVMKILGYTQWEKT